MLNWLNNFIENADWNKWMVSSGAGVVVGALWEWLGGYFSNFSNLNYALLVNIIILILIDTFLGVWVAIKYRIFSSDGFGSIFTKIIVYCLLFVSTHAATEYIIDGAPGVLSWLDNAVYAAICSRELLSVYENAALLTNFRVPDFLKKKIKEIVEGEGKKEN